MNKAFLTGFLIVLILSNACTSNGTKNNVNNELFKNSYKSLSQSEKADSEHFDIETGLYANYYAGFAMKFPYQWVFDRGNSEHTIARWIQEDSAFSFAINMIELNTDKDGPGLWSYYSNNKEEDDRFTREVFEKQLQSEISNFDTEKIWFSNHEALKRTFVYEVRHYDMEYDMKAIMIQISRKNRIFTMGLHMPLFSYYNNPEYFEKILEGFYFGSLKSQE